MNTNLDIKFTNHCRTVINSILIHDYEVVFHPYIFKEINGYRINNDFTLILKTQRPGLIIGERGEGIDHIRTRIEKWWDSENDVKLNKKNFAIQIIEVNPFNLIEE